MEGGEVKAFRNGNGRNLRAGESPPKKGWYLFYNKMAEMRRGSAKLFQEVRRQLGDIAKKCALCYTEKNPERKPDGEKMHADQKIIL